MAVLSVIVHSREQLGVARHKFEILEIKELYTALESLNCVCAGGNAERQTHEENCRDATQKYRPAFPSRRRIAIPRDGLALGSAKMQCMHFTSNAAFTLRTCRIVVGAFPDTLSRSSSRLSSGG